MPEFINESLPPYQIRISSKSKSIRIQISAKNGVQLIIPKFCKPEEGIKFLHSKKNWVETHLQSILKNKEQENKLPDILKLDAISASWQITYHQIADTESVRMISKPNEIALIGNINDVVKCKKLLSLFVKKQAKIHLEQWCNSISENIQLSFSEISIRGQTTRWGSCSYKKNINLNYKLLFLPKEWVEYVIIHELCHTKIFNHSNRFWGLVAKFCPEYERIKKAFKNVNQYLPTWVE